MKHDALRSIAHNVAASLASGVSFLIGFWDVDVYAAAELSPTGAVVVDFMNGSVEPSSGMDDLVRAAAEFPPVLPAFCDKHGVSLEAFREMRALYWATPSGGRFTVSITDEHGRRTETDYGGYDGHRIRIADHEGRVRPIPLRGS